MSPLRHLPLRLARSPFLLPLLFATVILGIFAPVLFTTRNILPTYDQSDLVILFAPMRAFAAEQLRAGHIPLWNPHIFCGSPFLGNFQSALLYPLTWLHLFLPLAPAINWTIALEYFLAAWFTSLCCQRRGATTIPAFIGGLAYALSGSVFLRLYAGHLATINTMTWAPLVLLSLDHILDEASLGWSLIGALAIALMFLAGSPPNVYNTALIFAVYTSIRFATLLFSPPLFLSTPSSLSPPLVPRGRARVGAAFRILILLSLMAMLSLTLSAAQLLPGLRAAHEAVRSTGTTYDFAADGPLPPENLLTLFSARIFGDKIQTPYTGRSYLWEANLFIGSATTLLAAAGILLAPAKQKWPLIIAATVAFILALGTYAHIGSFNLHHFLFDHFPMYNRFRTTGRFGYQITLCLALLASMGCQHLRIPTLRTFWLGIAALIAAGAATTIAFIHHNPTITTQSLIAASITATVGTLILLSKKYPLCIPAIAAIATIELITFAIHFRLTTDLDPPTPPEWSAALTQLAPTDRVLHNTFQYASQGMLHNYNDIYGYDPVILKRYAQLLAQSQNQNPDEVDYAPELTHPFPLLSFMRCRYLLIATHGQHQLFTNPTPPLPELQFIDTYEKITDPHDILDTLSEEAFDPTRRVILETDPDPIPIPAPDSPGHADVIAQTTDAIEIRATTTRPVLLVISNAYSQDWKITPLTTPPQPTYKILPANQAFIAIPLAAGDHHFLLAYNPTAWTTGLRITIISLIAWTAALLTCAIIKLKKLPV